MRTAKTLIRLGGCGCPGWSESSLGAHATLLVLSQGLNGQYYKSYAYNKMFVLWLIVHTLCVHSTPLRAFPGSFQHFAGMLQTYWKCAWRIWCWNIYWAKKEMIDTFFLNFKHQHNVFEHCYVLLSLGRHQTTTCTNLFSVSIIYRRFNLYWKHHKRWKTCNEFAQALRFLHCRTWIITINQKLYESCGISHTVQRNNRFNILCSLNCLPCN